MKIKFFTGSPLEFRKNAAKLYINPSYFYLRHFYRLHGKNDQVEWLMPEFFKIYTIDQALTLIEQEQPHVLGLSMFSGNHDYHLELAKLVKQKMPGIKIVLGGPELTVHKISGFFKSHNYIDFVVYGDGERAFTQLLDYFSGLDQDKSKWTNIVENVGGSELKYPYEGLTDPDFFNSSPYVDQKDFLVECLAYNQTQVANFAKGQKFNFQIGMEFARGCMYACTFCDWGQSLSKKVKRSKRDFYQDIDLFYELDLAFTETDANFGQWDQDLTLFDYALGKYEPSRNFQFVVSNTPKLKTKSIEYIVKKQLAHYNLRQVISMQDMNPDVLKNIDRPSLSLTSYYDLINRIKQELTEEQFQNLGAQLIVGLPGQNVKTMLSDVTDLIHKTGLKNFLVSPWWLLPNSPAGDPLYQKLHRLTIGRVYSVTSATADCDLETLYQRASTVGASDLRFSHANTVIQSGDFEWWDMQTMLYLYQQITATPTHVFKDKSYSQIEKIVNQLFNISKKRIDQQKVLHEPLMSKYSTRITGYYDTSTKTTYSYW